MKILDPACGSGSFLISALQYLFNYCALYIKEYPEAASIPASPRARKRTIKIAFQDNQGTWNLSPEFRSRLLSSCIYGVDIDAQAVEVTIMSLYLKLLEGRLPPNWQRQFLQSRLLPPMVNNICCGNSLLSQTDFDRYWEEKYVSLFGGDEDTKFRINAFDWNSETRGFGRLLEEHEGWHCIIGNPPYIRVQELKKWEPEECEFYKVNYKSAAKGNYDIYIVFIEKALQLLAPDGMLGFICPNKFWQATYGRNIRNIIAEGRHLFSIIDFADQQVFRGATNYTAIHVFSKKGGHSLVDYCRIARLTDGESQCRMLESADTLNSSDISRWHAVHPSKEDTIWSFPEEGSLVIVANEETKRFRLVDIVDFSQGFKTGADKVFVLHLISEKGRFLKVRSQATKAEHMLETEILQPLLKSEHMRRFEIRPTSLRLLFPYEVKKRTWRILDKEELAKRFPCAWKYLLTVRAHLDRRESGRFAGDEFYQYSRQQNFIPLSKPKLITPDMADRMRFSFDEQGEFVFSGGAAGGVCLIPHEGIDPFLIMGILNSALIEQQIRQRNGPGFRGGYLNCEIRFLRDIPIQLPASRSQEKATTEIADRVRQIMVQKNLLQAPLIDDTKKGRLGREIEAHEIRINELVCQLYGVDEIPH